MDRDEAYAQVVAILFGDGAPEQIAKAATPADNDRTKRRLTAGLSAVGGTAGAVGLIYSGKKLGEAYRKTPKALGTLKRVGQTARSDKLGTTLLPLEVAGLGGEVLATHILHNDAKKVAKSSPDVADLHVVGGEQKPKRRIPRSKGELTLVAASKGGPYVARGTVKATKASYRGAKVAGRGAVKGGRLVKTQVAEKTPVVLDKTRTFTEKATAKVKETKDKVAKSGLDVVWEAEISKVDTDKRQVFGWASIVEVNGEPVVDLQGDYITPEEIEKAAYDYVHKSRKGGDMHKRDGDQPLHVSDLIESFVVTDEKKKLLGMPESTPTGWWTGWQVNDPQVWAEVKKGNRLGLSIHGKGKRVPVDA